MYDDDFMGWQLDDVLEGFEVDFAIDGIAIDSCGEPRDPLLDEHNRARLDRDDGIDRSRYEWSGPNGSPRPVRDYSPNTPMRTSLGERARKRSA